MDVIAGPWDSFVATLPTDPETPVVVSVPHAGTELGPFAAPLASNLEVRTDADLFVADLYEGAPKGAFVRARLSRFVCDLNRHPDDVSARAVPSHPQPRNTNGRGFIWEITTDASQALQRPLTLEEWEQRRAIHEAYYGALKQALDRATNKFGYAILVDGHSMPSQGRAGHTDPGAPRADIVPGDRCGQSCSPAVSHQVADHFRQNGFGVQFNTPYQGGFITTHHGRPDQHVHAIQIEMRRDLYMDETTFVKKAEGFARLREAIAGLLRRLDAFNPLQA